MQSEFLYHALNIGERMLVSGAEVSRVEDTLKRICMTYGAERVDVFTITSSIIITVYAKEFGAVTQTRRIEGQKYNLNELDLLNQLSRKICRDKPDYAYIEKEINRIAGMPQYSFRTQLFIYALISGSFALFFGGNAGDAIASAFIGIILKCVQSLLTRIEINPFFAVFSCSCLGGLLATFCTRFEIGLHADMISMGNIMLLIPGIALTNSIRDMLEGDTISGLLRFSEAILISLTIAFGFALIGTIC